MKILTGIPTPSPLQYLTAQPPQPKAKLVVLFCKVVCVRPMGLETSGGPSVVIPELGSTYFCSLCGLSESLGFSGGSDIKKKKKICLQFRRPQFDLWVGKISWRRGWQPTSVFFSGKIPWTEEPGELQPMGSQKSRTWLSNYTSISVNPQAVASMVKAR